MTIRIASFTDGTSNTHVASELLQGAQDDIRGTIWVDNPGAGSYMTRFTPNGYQDYIPLIAPWSALASGVGLNNADNLARGAVRAWARARRLPARFATASRFKA